MAPSPATERGEDAMRETGRSRLADFSLDPAKAHLNHGAYGAVPRALQSAQADWRARMEANPSGFIRNQLPALLEAARGRLAAALGGKGADWVFVDNATAGANCVAASLKLGPGDEVLTTSEVYNAVRQALAHHGSGRGARVIEVPVPLPPDGGAPVTEALCRHIGPRTKAVFVDHVTSAAGLVLPVADIANACRAAGVPLFVDGAHGPGMLDLDVPALGCDWYAGNGHKWLSAPRGCGFLWAAPERQADLHPPVISHGYGQGLAAEFGWVGTRDPSAWLTAADALDWHDAQGGTALRRRNRDLACRMGARLSAALDAPLAAPPELMGAMAAVRLPAGPGGGREPRRAGAPARQRARRRRRRQPHRRGPLAARLGRPLQRDGRLREAGRGAGGGAAGRGATLTSQGFASMPCARRRESSGAAPSFAGKAVDCQCLGCCPPGSLQPCCWSALPPPCRS